MPVAVALAHGSHCLTPRTLLAAADAAAHRGLLRSSDLVFPGHAARTGAWLSERLDPRAESPLESLARLDLVEAGFRVESQVRLPGVGRVDLLVERRVVVELDGHEFHVAPAAFAEDRRRDREAQMRGIPVLRFTYRDLMDHSGAVSDAVTAVLSVGPNDAALRRAIAS